MEQSVYRISCTPEQTERAIKLGAPFFTPSDYSEPVVPSAEEMLGWLREQGIEVLIDIIYKDDKVYWVFGTICDFSIHKTYVTGHEFISYMEAVNYAIDVALEYLEGDRKVTNLMQNGQRDL